MWSFRTPLVKWTPFLHAGILVSIYKSFLSYRPSLDNQSLITAISNPSIEMNTCFFPRSIWIRKETSRLVSKFSWCIYMKRLRCFIYFLLVLVDCLGHTETSGFEKDSKYLCLAIQSLDRDILAKVQMCGQHRRFPHLLQFCCQFLINSLIILTDKHNNETMGWYSGH